jgi:hypothetical protein
LRSLGSTHSQWQTYHDLLYLIFPNDPLQRRQIGPLILSLKRLQTLRRNSQRIGHSNPDPSGAYIQTEDPSYPPMRRR